LSKSVVLQPWLPARTPAVIVTPTPLTVPVVSVKPVSLVESVFVTFQIPASPAAA